MGRGAGAGPIVQVGKAGHRGSRRLLVLCGLALTSCTVGPRYTKPTVAVPPAYKEQPPASFKEAKGWKPAQPSDGNIRADWWNLFGEAPLDRLEARIDLSNQDLKIAEAHFREARALARIARAGLYPTITVSPSLSSNRLSTNRAIGGALSPPGGYGDFTLPFDLSYELDVWGRVRRSIAAAREEAQATAGDLETARLSLHAELAVDYFELHALDAQKRILDDTLAAYRKALELTQNRFDGGVANEAEVAQAQTQLATTDAQETDVTVGRAEFEHAIAVLTGDPPATLSIPEVPLQSAPPAIPVGVPSAVLERRPDIASAERRVAEANEEIGIARAAFFPSILLSAAGGFEGRSIVDWLTWPSRFWAVGPSVLQTIFDAGRRRAASESALANYDATVAGYRQTVLTAFQQVEDNLSTLRILEQEAQKQHTAVQAAEHSLDVSLNRYKGGLVTYLEVVTAQTVALENERTELDILRRRMDASVLLIKALGGGWDVSKLPNG